MSIDLQQHMPNAGCKMPMIPAIEELKPVKFWKSWKTKDADCLFWLQTRMVTIVAMKETILKIKAPFEILSSSLGPHMFMKVANNVIQYATRTVCHLWIS
jgi:hypothetical protein